ncbi:MAG: hypothetical protein O3B01_01500 [Planctomycetota bacterium]|nr:hypothetical protein [Planctomycetota bacterium]MDA1137232.1 hypothetical protein [Planctomycetota bacterium]
MRSTEPLSSRLQSAWRAGSTNIIPHPDFVAVVNERGILMVHDETWSVVEPLQIVSLMFREREPAHSGSGK